MSIVEPLSIGLIQGLVFALPVIGLAIAYRLFSFPDISVEASFLLGACAFTATTRAHFSIGATLVAAACAGGITGSITSLLHARFRVNKFMAGILVASAAYSIALRALETPNLGLLQYRTLFDLVQPFNEWLGTPRSDAASALLLVSSIGVICYYLWLFFNCRCGLQLRVGAVGGVPASNLGLAQICQLTAGLALTGSLTAVGGSLMSMRQGFYDLGMNQGVLIVGLASLSIGERFRFDRYLGAVGAVLVASVVGSIVYQVTIAYVIRFGAHPADVKLITTALVLLTLVAKNNDQTKHQD